MRERLIKFFEQYLGLAPGSITDQTALYTSGLLDSFSMVETLMFIEQETGIRFEPEDLSVDNLDSVERILELIRERQAQEA